MILLSHTYTVNTALTQLISISLGNERIIQVHRKSLPHHSCYPPFVQSKLRCIFFLITEQISITTQTMDRIAGDTYFRVSYNFQNSKRIANCVIFRELVQHVFAGHERFFCTEVDCEACFPLQQYRSET